MGNVVDTVNAALPQPKSDYALADPSGDAPILNLGLDSLLYYANRPRHEEKDVVHEIEEKHFDDDKALIEGLPDLSVPIHIKPIDDDEASVYVTRYIYPTLYKNVGRQFIVMSRVFGDLHRRSVTAQLNMGDDEIRLMGADNDEHLVTVTPYTITFNFGDTSLRLRYNKSGPYLDSKDVVPGVGTLQNPDFKRRITFDETSLLELLPFGFAFDWLPEKAFTAAHDVPGQRDSQVAQRFCRVLRNESAFLAKTTNPDQVFLTPNKNMWTIRVNTQHGKPVTLDESSALVIRSCVLFVAVNQLERRIPVTVVPLCIEYYQNNERQRTGHLVALLASLDTYPVEVKRKRLNVLKQTIFVFDPNGAEEWNGELKDMIVREYMKCKTTELKSLMDVVVHRVPYQFQVEEKKFFQSISQYDSKVREYVATDGGRCQLWGLYMIYVFLRYVGTGRYTTTQLTKVMFAVPPQLMYQILALYSEYVLAVSENQITP